jgi:hypothetical protein
MPRSAMVVLAVFLLVPALAPADQAPPPPGDTSKLLEMLRDPLLWGPDAATALAAVPALARAGEEQVAILPQRVVGQRKYPSRGQAVRAASVAMTAMQAAPRMRVQLGAPPPRAARPALRLAAVVFPDDRSLHVGTPDSEARYLAADARIDQVEQRFGKAERVTTVVIDDGTERRPLELRLYHFAKDALIVVTATYRSDPRLVDRVLLDTKAVMQAAF